MLETEIKIKKTASVLSPGLNLNLGLDLGSTETRFRKFNYDGEMCEEVLTVPSDTGIVTEISNIKSNSNKLKDIMEFLIKDITPNKQDKINAHLIKGNLLNETRSINLKRSSKVFKTLIDATYTDILIAIIIQVIHDYNNKNLNFTKVIPDLAIALPTVEASNMKTCELFRNRLAGTYEVVMPRLGLQINIEIKKDKIFIDAEPNCVQFYLMSKLPELTDMTTLTIDGGGKTTDISYAYEGVLNTDVGLTGSYGGNTLESDILQTYLKETGSTAPKQTQINKALINGKLVRGMQSEDIYKIIDSEKDLMAKRIFDDLLSVVNRADSTLEDINLFVFHGRLFTDTVFNDNTKSSLVDKVLEQIKSSLTNKKLKIASEVILETDDICSGVILSKLSESYED